MFAAWYEARPRMTEVINQLESPKNVPIDTLSSLGLIGYQLLFKLSIFQHALDDYLDFLSRTQTIPRPIEPTSPPILVKEPEPEGWFAKRIARKLMKRALKAGDVILDSLAAAFPPLHAVKDFNPSARASARR